MVTHNEALSSQWKHFVSSLVCDPPPLYKIIPKELCSFAISSEALMDTLLAASEDMETTKAQWFLSLPSTKKTFKIRENPKTVLPLKSDRTLERYWSRMMRYSQVPELFLNIKAAFNYFPASLRFEFREFFEAWTRSEFFKTPAELITTGIFMGEYTSTPFGIHQDPLYNFTFVTEGERVYYFWPSHFFAERPNPQHTHRFLSQATCVKAKKGDILFWPPSTWHVAGTKGFSAAIGFAFWNTLKGPYSQSEVFKSYVKKHCHWNIARQPVSDAVTIPSIAQELSQYVQSDLLMLDVISEAARFWINGTISVEEIEGVHWSS